MYKLVTVIYVLLSHAASRNRAAILVLNALDCLG